MPHNDDDRLTWLKNLKSKIAVQGSKVGMLPADITNITTITTDSISAIEDNEEVQIAATTSTTTKNLIVSKGESTIRPLVRRMKESSGCTESIEEDLQIISKEPVFKSAEHKPIIKVLVMPAKVVISFVKEKLDGMNIYERLNGTAKWEKLAYNSYSPYTDNRPLAVAGVSEHREYMAIGVIHDEEVTLQSDIMEAVFGG